MSAHLRVVPAPGFEHALIRRTEPTSIQELQTLEDVARYVLGPLDQARDEIRDGLTRRDSARVVEGLGRVVGLSFFARKHRDELTERRGW